MSPSRLNTPRPSSLASLIATAAVSPTGDDADLQSALTELERQAGITVLRNGVVMSDALRTNVDAVAARHLRRSDAERELSRAFAKVSDRQVRNRIEVAHGQVLDLSEIAYYYAGLRAGVALTELNKNRR